MKYCILVETNQTFVVNGKGNKVPALFFLDAYENKPRLFDSEEEANQVLAELKKDPHFNLARIEKFHE